MTWFQIYAFYGIPLLVLGVGLLIYYIAAHDLDLPKRLRRPPAE